MTTTDLRIGELHAPARIAAQLWPLDDIADRYRRLREVTAAMEPDPLLPPDLLPRPWVGAQARNAFAQC